MSLQIGIFVLFVFPPTITTTRGPTWSDILSSDYSSRGRVSRSDNNYSAAAGAADCCGGLPWRACADPLPCLEDRISTETPALT